MQGDLHFSVCFWFTLFSGPVVIGLLMFFQKTPSFLQIFTMVAILGLLFGAPWCFAFLKIIHYVYESHFV